MKRMRTNKHNLLVIYFILLGLTNMCAQSNIKDTLQNKPIDKYITAPLSSTPDSIRVYTKVDTMPQFREDINKYIQDSIRYPQEAKEKKIQGTVYIGLIIEKDGSISNIKVLRSYYPILTNEAIRLVSTMPNWIPGKQKGKTVRVQYIIPIHFNLPATSAGSTMKK